MQTYYFIRTVPLLVGVEAETQGEGWTLSGERLDDFMTDAVQIDKWDHQKEWEGKDQYSIEYHGDAIYGQEVHNAVVMERQHGNRPKEHVRAEA